MRRPDRASPGIAFLGMGALALQGGCRPHQPEPRPPDSLLILVPALPESLDPFQEIAGSGELIFFNAYEPLLRSSSSGEAEPALAGSWDASRAGELSVRLKPGQKFHDGTPLEASQVVASLDAARQAGSRFAVRLAGVAEVRASGRDVVTLRAVAGGALPPLVLADIPVVNLTPGGIPGGTGPYRVTAFTAGLSATLAAAEGRSSRPSLTRVTVRRFAGPADVRKELLGPEPPLVVAAPRELVALARSNDKYRIVRQPGTEVIALAMDLAREPTPGVGLTGNPFLRPEVRRALRIALDREALRKSLEDGSIPVAQLAPPAAFGFDPQLEPVAPRVDEARSLLRAAGLPRGFEVRLDLAREHEALGRVLLAQLEGVGIRVKLNPLEAKQLAHVLKEESSLALFAWAPAPDIVSALGAGMHTRAPERGLGAGNWTGYGDAEVDRGIENARAASDPAARRAAIQAALRRLAEDSAWVPLLAPNVTLVLPKGLTFPARLDGRIPLAGARLEPSPTPTPRPTRRRRDTEKRASAGSLARM